jgi:hypothetical protein
MQVLKYFSDPYGKQSSFLNRGFVAVSPAFIDTCSGLQPASQRREKEVT